MKGQNSLELEGESTIIHKRDNTLYEDKKSTEKGSNMLGTSRTKEDNDDQRNGLGTMVGSYGTAGP